MPNLAAPLIVPDAPPTVKGERTVKAPHPRRFVGALLAALDGEG
jgi:hypothetical protein